MRKWIVAFSAWRRVLAVLAGIGSLAGPAAAQSRLPAMPGYEQYQRMAQPLQDAAQAVRQSGALNVSWSEDGGSFEYSMGETRYRFDIAARRATEIESPPSQDGGRGGRGGRGGGPARGRQFVSADSPDGAHVASHRDRNLWISDANGGNERAITTDGSEELRIKYGTASWVYGEELGQSSAMWWAPDGKKLAYYRFDESGVQDYFLQLDQTGIQSSLDVEAYPKAGTPNPAVDIFVYDLASGQTTRVDVRMGRPFEPAVVGYYVYRVAWTPDGTELLVNRSNRHQNIMEFTACNPTTGACRVIVREEWPTGWVENSPAIRWLEDGKRFLWESERTGWNNLYLYDVTGKLLATLTNHEFEVSGIVRLDEDAGVVWYTARDGDNFLKTQLHRVGLDGRGETRITDPAFNHSISLAPDGRHFVDIAETHDTPPVTRLIDTDGRVVAELARGDAAPLDRLGVRRVEMFTYTADDGTPLFGTISFPTNFDPARKYPVLVPVYGGPASGGNTPRETFTVPSALTEYGFLVVNVSSRATPGMGKRKLDTIYQKLGVVEIDDMAAGIRALRDRLYVDADRVGIYGTSYGGYTAVMAILRHPDVFAAASASSPVTDWRHYDTIYTERYMRTPQENEAGYDAGSAMTYVENLRGRLMLYYGTADNNVHPNNTMQLVQALQQARKSFDIQVGPDRGHTAIDNARMMEFFIESLGGPAAN
jgi:dipeptidyl-peptidase-4